MIILTLAGAMTACGDDSSTTSTGSGGSGGSGGSAGSGGSSGDGGGGAGGADAGDMKITSSTGTPTVYRDPYADGGANPIPESVMASADAFATATGMRVTLTVSGLPMNRPFGAHIHKLACDDNKAGTHYQNNPAPDGGATDPMYANAMNEVWLDFVTDGTGAATKTAEVSFVPRKGEAKAIVIHDMMTMTGGVAGAKLACISMPF
jgi:Cu-Zn family superoxide dismutase